MMVGKIGVMALKRGEFRVKKLLSVEKKVSFKISLHA